MTTRLSSKKRVSFAHAGFDKRMSTSTEHRCAICPNNGILYCPHGSRIEDNDTIPFSAAGVFQQVTP